MALVFGADFITTIKVGNTQTFFEIINYTNNQLKVILFVF
jgi:hypothetical protein